MNKFGYVKSPVRVNSLNALLPDMCKKAGIKVKTAHCLRVTCATKLFTSGMEEKMIRERMTDRSNALFSYQKPSDHQISNVSKSLGPCSSTITAAPTSNDGESAQPAICASVGSPACANEQYQTLSSGMFFDCNVNVTINEKE